MQTKILNFKFVPKPINLRTKRTDTGNKRISKLLVGTVFIEDGIYKVKVELELGTYRIFEFTKESYNLKGRTTIFDKRTKHEDKKTRYVRQISDSIGHPGDSNRFVPFAANWKVNGYITKVNMKELFDFNDLLEPEQYREHLDDLNYDTI